MTGKREAIEATRTRVGEILGYLEDQKVREGSGMTLRKNNARRGGGGGGGERVVGGEKGDLSSLIADQSSPPPREGIA